jgi:hypothetical protein
MTEQEWIACNNPASMLTFLRRRLKTRQARLFGCGYLRQIWGRLEGKEGSSEAVIVAERFADGNATRKELATARSSAEATAEAWSDPAIDEPVWQAVDAVSNDAWEFFERIRYETSEEWSEPDLIPARSAKLVKERREARHALYIHLLRDLAGNPFRRVKAKPSWLTWNNRAIVKAAAAAYEERSLPSGHLDNTRLAVIGDMLEEAGCRDAEILGHLREAGAIHVRGCFVIDLLLQKE